jgi:hypothetical protein
MPPGPNRPDLQRTFRPSLVRRITSWLFDISVETNAQPFLNGTGPGPYMTQGHLEWSWTGVALDFSPGKRFFKPA